MGSSGRISLEPRPARKRHRPEEIIARLRQIEMLTGQGKSISEAVKTVAVTETTYFRWRAEFGGMKTDQVKRMTVLELENARLRRAVSDLPRRRLGRSSGAATRAVESPSRHSRRALSPPHQSVRPANSHHRSTAIDDPPACSALRPLEPCPSPHVRCGRA